MGIHVIKMPDIGEGIAEVELVAWYVKVGDAVTEDQVLADVMTDKATVEIPSSVTGTVVALGGAVGQVMAVGAELVRIEVEGAGNLRADAASAPVVANKAVLPSTPPIAERDVTRSPVPEVNQLRVEPNFPDRPGLPTQAVTHQVPQRAAGEKPIASPVVRRLAWDMGIELQYVSGSGPAGRITRDDVLAYASRVERGAASVTADARYARRTDESQVPVIGLRRKIAQKMQEAKRRIPHFTYVEEVDMTALEDLRAQLNSVHGKARGKLTVIPFLARAMVLALREFPHLNARYDDEHDTVTQYGAVHLGIAAQTPAGLMVPVIRHAETLDLWACAAEVSRLAESAKAGKASREELSGSTITLTSLGALGGIVTTPVINHPEVAIVGVNRLVERPVVRGGQVVVRKMMNLSSSFDHRVVDGLHAAEFIQMVRGMLENPATLFVE
jgi:2-oxoisovalerate dehydrogenase E2 component (dihydrolipoyl transacylase)